MRIMAAAISIHTPVKGVTADWGHGDAVVPISIHTPVKGVTPANQAKLSQLFIFQSTHP